MAMLANSFRHSTFKTAVIWLVLFATVLVLPQFAGAASDFEDLHYMTEEYYPFNFKVAGGVTGLSVELLRAVWKQVGVRRQPVSLLPWARAYDALQHDPKGVLFCMARTPERERLFKWAGPVYSSRFYLVAKKDRKITIKTPADLSRYTIGTVRDDIVDQVLATKLKHGRLQRVASQEINLKKLCQGRVDLAAFSEVSFKKMLMVRGLDPEDFDFVYLVKASSIYYAFNLEVPDSLVRRFQHALERVIAAGQYQRLLDRFIQ